MCAYLQKSFGRIHPYNWTDLDQFVIRLRGDGRRYRFNVGFDKLFDVHWNDLHYYPIITHGGPYWQTVVVSAMSALRVPAKCTRAEHIIWVVDRRQFKRVCLLCVCRCRFRS